MQSCANMWRQQMALIARYGVIISRGPIRSFIRLLLWPGLLFGIGIFVLRKLDSSNDYARYEFIRISTSHLPVLVTFFFVYWFADLLIKDKASGMKKLMLSMGLKRFNYYCANVICAQMYLLTVSLIIAILVKVYLLDDTIGWPAIVLLFTLFSLHLDSITSFLVSFITSSSYSSIIPLLLFFEQLLNLLANYIVTHTTSETYKQMILILVSLSPYQPVRMFFNGYLKDHNSNERTNGLSQSWAAVNAEQMVWIVLFKLFACWFEEVCPWQKVSAVLGPCFCFSKREDRYQDIEDTLEDTGISSKYFEHRAHTKEVGIKISSVTKIFGNNPAVNDVSFSIYKGETTLLLGHNGAGKTTLMNIILGLLNPNHGKVRVKKRPGTTSSVGVCPQASILDDDLNVRQHLALFNDIKSSISGPERDQHIQQTIDDVSLGSHAEKLPQELSGGMKRKLSLGMAFVGKSDVLILDEPSSGLDPDSRMFIWNAIRRYRTDRTVLLSTQHMEEADYLGDRIAIMSGGQIVCCGSSVYLNKLFGTGYKLRVECKTSIRKQVLDHIRSHFDDAQPVESHSATSSHESKNDNNADFVVELKMKNRDGDSEMHLIKLLQDIENNSEALGVHSYGLKSSSIEDVMLNSSKYFSATSEPETVTKDTMLSGRDQFDRMRIKNETRTQARLRIVSALCVKQLQSYRFNWLLVLLTKILLPILGAYATISGSNKDISPGYIWQDPVTVLMIGQFVYFPVKERVSKFKIMQLESNASVWLYWLSQFIIDLLWVIIPLISVNIFLATSFEGNLLVSAGHMHLLVSMETLLFCIASIMFCYLLSTMMTKAETSYGYLIMIFAISFILYVLTLLLKLAVESDLEFIQDLLSHTCIVFIPGDAYKYSLYGLASGCYFKRSLTNKCTPQKGISPIPIGMLALVFQTLFYTAILYLVELHKFDLAWYISPRNIYYCIMRKTPRASGALLGGTDTDVVEENKKALLSIKSPISIDTCLTAAKLNKSYYRIAKVIEDLSFTVKKGECFGLLGVNGAGKSTTFSMLSSEASPDSGRILANGHYLDQDLHKYREMLGYDPQSNPELSLTAYQALHLMARLRGVDNHCIPMLIKFISDLLDMSQHMNKLDSDLSGGTKRKLALGMALIGNPSILMLDEPTAGVDPFARRGVWRLLRSIRSRGDVSIIISSHAMEECEAICDRISIMARGQLRCIGTFLHLRSKFAKGCTLRVQFSTKSSGPNDFNGSSDESHQAPTNNYPMHRQQAKSTRSSGSKANNLTEASIPELKRLLDDAVGSPNYKLADKNANSLTFEITDNKVRRSILFITMREFRQKHPYVSYIINDSSLEDIFIALAREQQEGEIVHGE